MLKEEIQYNDDFPVNILINGIKEYPAHYHSDIEVICILDGSIRIKDSLFSCCLNAGDVYVFNSKTHHSIHSISPTNIVLIMHINLNHYTNIIEDIEKINFLCPSFLKKNESENELMHVRYLLMKILDVYYRKDISYDYFLNHYTKVLLSFLKDHFQSFLNDETITNNADHKDEGKYKTRNEQVKRIHRITNYINKHYMENITLSDIAEQEYLNNYYLSHLIKNTCGLTFTEVLSLARVEAAEKLLLESNKNIEAIASETGFTTRKYLNIHFKRWNEMTPSDFRRRYKNNKKKSIEYLSFSQEVAANKIDAYYYGDQENRHITSFKQDTYTPDVHEAKFIEFSKAFQVSSKLYELIMENDQFSSIEEFLNTLNLQLDELTDYNSFISSIIRHLKDDVLNEADKNQLLSLLEQIE